MNQQLNVKNLLHPSETSRFILALLVCVPVLIVFLVITYVTFGVILLVVGFIVAMAWFGLEIAKALFTGHAVKVSEINFPEIQAILVYVKERLAYKGDVAVFIVEEGSVNALLAKFFRTKFIVLHSGMADHVGSGDGQIQVEFIIARFIGALKAKHFRLNVLRILINSLEKIAIFNLFLLPYERAVQYSGDQIGLAVCQDLDNAVWAFTRMMVGNKLFKDVNPSAILAQSREVSGFFGFMARLFSTHPHMVDRYTNLLAFARKRYPELYEGYVSRQEPHLRSQLDRALKRISTHR